MPGLLVTLGSCQGCWLCLALATPACTLASHAVLGLAGGADGSALKEHRQGPNDSWARLTVMQGCSCSCC